MKVLRNLKRTKMSSFIHSPPTKVLLGSILILGIIFLISREWKSFHTTSEDLIYLTDEYNALREKANLRHKVECVPYEMLDIFNIKQKEIFVDN